MLLHIACLSAHNYPSTIPPHSYRFIYQVKLAASSAEFSRDTIDTKLTHKLVEDTKPVANANVPLGICHHSEPATTDRHISVVDHFANVLNAESVDGKFTLAACYKRLVISTMQAKVVTIIATVICIVATIMLPSPSVSNVICVSSRMRPCTRWTNPNIVVVAQTLATRTSLFISKPLIRA